MTSTPTPILFLSGAGLPAWIWDDVRRRLGERETVVAPRPADPRAPLRDHALAALETAPAGAVTVVAHSAGGVTGAELARISPERVGAFLALSAVIAAPGGSFVAAMPAPQRWVLDVAMRIVGTRPPASAIRNALAHGLDEHVAERIVAEFHPESPGLYRDRIGPEPWSGRRGYVHTARDRELPLALQRRWAERLGATWRHDLSTGHLPMLEDPEALADSIKTFVDGSED